MDDLEDVLLTEAELVATIDRVRQLDLTSCAFVGDSGCTDPDCWQCHSPLGPVNLRLLAKNLATAAALCRAHRLGFDEGMDAAGIGEGYPSAHPWTPGCRRPSP